VIIALSLVPAVWELYRARRLRRRPAPGLPSE